MLGSYDYLDSVVCQDDTPASPAEGGKEAQELHGVEAKPSCPTSDALASKVAPHRIRLPFIKQPLSEEEALDGLQFAIDALQDMDFTRAFVLASSMGGATIPRLLAKMYQPFLCNTLQLEVSSDTILDVYGEYGRALRICMAKYPR